jgi:hypothetical protein
MIRENLKVAQFHQKSYADKRRRDLAFKVGDFVYLKVSPMRGTRWFKVKGKMAPRYVSPFQILDRKGEVVYQLELPLQLSEGHDVFHMSQLKKCQWVPKEQIPMEQLDLGGDLSCSKWPIRILYTAEWVTHSKVIKMCKVQWSHHTEDEATWEHEEELWADYPELLNLEGEIPFKGGGVRFVTPTFCIIKFCQARTALGCILKILATRKDFSIYFGLRLYSWHDIFYFLKILENHRRI